jgi:hypothetical protein
MPAAQWILLAAVLGLGGCATPAVSRPPSPASTCAATAMQQVPPGLDTGLTQCVAAALVEGQCGSFDPAIMGTRNDAGHRCARRGATPGELIDCCRAALGSRR